MKNCPLLWICLFFTLGGADMQGVESTGRNYGSQMAVNADVQADFYKRYPDLEDEREVVAAAARALDAEGMETQDLAIAAAMLAKRTRALLDQRTPQQWNQKAVSLFPQLGIAGSEFNTLFLRHFNELKQTSPQFLEEPSWPVLLARRCADELRPPATVVSGATKNDAQKTVAAAPLGEAQGPRPPSKWLDLLNFGLLLTIIMQPARLLFRCRRAFAGSDGPVTLWQRALGPAAWTYLLFALIALVRTFLANADQRFFDRFGITLLVSLVAGVVFALPAYGVALGSIWWRRRRTPATPKGPDKELVGSGAIPAGGRKG